MISEYIYRIEKTRSFFDQNSNDRYAIYGTGKNAMGILNTIQNAPILCIIRNQEDGNIFCGKPILSLDEAVAIGINKIIIAAQIDSEYCIAQRLLPYVNSHGIELFDMYGNDVSVLLKEIISAKLKITGYNEKYWESVRGALKECRTVSIRESELFHKDLDLNRNEVLMNNSTVDFLVGLKNEGKRIVVIKDDPDGNDSGVNLEQFDLWEIPGKNTFFSGAFRLLLDEYGKNIIHIGTDILLDVFTPKIYGIQTYYLLPALEMLKASEIGALLLGTESNSDKEGWLRGLAYQVANRVDYNFSQFDNNFMYDTYSRYIEKFRNLCDKNDLIRISTEKSKKMLVADIWIPPYDRNAGARCTYDYLRTFKRIGYEVYYISTHFMKEEPYQSELEQLGIHCLTGNNYKRYWKLWLMAYGNEFSVVYLQRPAVGQMMMDTVVNCCPNARKIYFAHDLHYLRLMRQYDVSHNPDDLKESDRLKEVESSLFNKADVIHVVGSYEKQVLNDEWHKQNVSNIPLYIYDAPFCANSKNNIEKSGIMFVGGIGHQPNRDAVLRLANVIFTQVQKSIPNIKLTLVGSGIKELLEENDISNESIITYENISDDKLKDLYLESKLVVAPLRFGAGVKGKVVEASYYGVPVITTDIGAEGISTEFGNIIVKNDAEGFANTIVELYNDEERIEELSKQAAKMIQKYYSFDAAKEILERDFKK
ncbi:glycosyltransferase family 4 protein [Butyrivibrio sp. WCD2001]|uniref:glycosyltransferase family 4 protein n=1 Tax=Butyrivibrio sp. WCD2001 TaxID=1280681 RepID=UPI00040844ED|nr:glycosyltransferase family 4 protein [Butyrivibrio sp. WCD2001]